MKKINKDVKVLFCWAIIASILFVVGIPLIPIFAGKNWFVMALGIVFVVFGFYGTPLLWVAYGSKRSLKRVVEAITEEHLYSNKDIALHIQTTEQNVKDQIIKAIRKKYITGFVYDGIELHLNEKQKQMNMVEVNKCKNCSAALTVTQEKIYCKYCGTIYGTASNDNK